MIDEYLELKELKITYNKIMDLLFDIRHTDLPLLITNPEK